ncbi:MAG: sigma-70 family RNA polymerase sigma factor [Clostridia bacterium]|nr:sigma-70 family RNA polymerase sigma factor [Clostridia bacterium]
MRNVDMEELYNEYFKMVYKYLICLTHNNEIAEDLTQETFCKAIYRINTFKQDCKISTWLCTIAKNLWIDELKKNKKLDLANIDNLIDKQFNLEEDFFREQDKRELYKKINELDELTKRIFYLKLVENLTFKEIGDIMGKNEVWARVKFYRAKLKIKESD